MEVRNLRVKILGSKHGKRALAESFLFSLVSGYVFYKSWVGMLFIFLISIYFTPKRIEALVENERSKNAESFVDILRVIRRLSASGMSINACMGRAQRELRALYPDDQSWVITSLQTINTKLITDPNLAQHLLEWGQKEKIRDIADFGRVLHVIQSYGGDVSEKLGEITLSISQKIETERQIWILASSKIFEQKVMYYLGYGMILMLNYVMPDMFAVLYGSLVGRFVMTLSFALMIMGKSLGMRLTKIEV